MRGKRNPHNKKLRMDLVHVIVCVGIVGVATAAFLDLERRYILFPVVFFLAALLNILNGVSRLRNTRGEDASFVSGIAMCIVGALLFLLTIVSGYVSYLQYR